jgi:hypothetical protein
MAKVLGIHLLDLKPGVTDEQAQEMAARLTREFSMPGLTTRMAKSDRGPRAGQYMMVCEVDSLERRDRYWPKSGEASAEFNQHFAPLAALAEQAGAVFVFPDPNFNDYLEIGE